MAKKASVDGTTLRLIEEVNARKAEIARVEKPDWKTKCQFIEREGGPVVNLHVESDVVKLISILGFIMQKAEFYVRAEEALRVEGPAFTWQDFSVSDWQADISARIAKIQVGRLRAKLEALEGRLNAVLSPELKRDLELQAIEAELAKK